MSSGDRNTLALAFFFASLDQDPALGNKIVVIDDPISSLDDHRSLTTVQEIRRLAERAAQVIVLSHKKPFLCRIWERTDRTIRAALQVARDGAGSALRSWKVDQDCVTEHDRRHAMLREYLAGTTSNSREVATAIRPLMEAFLRVACPEYFPPGTLVGQSGQFVGLSDQGLRKRCFRLKVPIPPQGYWSAPPGRRVKSSSGRIGVIMRERECDLNTHGCTRAILIRRLT